MDTLGAKKVEGNIKSLGTSKGIAHHQQVGHSLGGSKDGEEDVTERRCPPFSNPEAVWKRQRSDLLPNLADFRELDAHVLRVSGQLNPKRGLWSVQTVVSLIMGEASSQLEKARAIWVWLCQNIEYDVCGFLGLSKKIHLPQEVLQTGRGVCSGYAHLFYEMCKEVGLTCAEISGYGRDVGESYGQCCPQKKSNHMWNALKLDTRWFLLDVCWGAGQVDLAQKQFIRRQEDFFFLTKPEEFIQSHWPEDPRWQLIHPPIPQEVF
ncbi:kyphoscoliosis peptidase-like isoform 3-T6 [Liasis olivaceus]